MTERTERLAEAIATKVRKRIAEATAMPSMMQGVALAAIEVDLRDEIAALLSEKREPERAYWRRQRLVWIRCRSSTASSRAARM